MKAEELRMLSERDLLEHRSKLVRQSRLEMQETESLNRNPNTQELRQIENLLDEVDRCTEELDRRRGTHQSLADPNGPWDRNPMRLERGEVRCLDLRENLSDVVRQQPLPDGIRAGDLSLGRLFRACVTGDWSDAPAEARTLAESTPSAGGFAVPEPLAAGILDLARNKAQLMVAGARTVPMESSTLRLAKLASDPTAAWKAENAAGTPSDATFAGIELKAKTLMTLVKLSVELAEDAGNLDALVKDAMSSAMSLELDRVGFYGSGSDSEPLGISGTSGIQVISMGTDGAALTSFDQFSQAVQKVAEANGPVNGLAAVYAPRTWSTLDQMKNGEGDPLKPPESFTMLKRLVTNQIPIDETQGSADDATSIFVGDFRQVMVGMRTGLTFEISRTSSDSTSSAFSNLQVWIRVYMRADIALARPDHLVRIYGIVPAE